MYTCSSCKKSNYFKPKMNSRAALQMKFGDEVRVNCPNCGKLDKKHLNKITATTDLRLIVLGGVLGVIGSIFLLSFLGVIASFLSCSLPFLLWNMENKSVGEFNRYAIKRK